MEFDIKELSSQILFVLTQLAEDIVTMDKFQVPPILVLDLAPHVHFLGPSHTLISHEDEEV